MHFFSDWSNNPYLAIKVGFWWGVQPNCNSVKKKKKTLTHSFAVFILFKPGTFYTSKSVKVVECLLW